MVAVGTQDHTMKNGKEWFQGVTGGTIVLVPHHFRKVNASHLKIRYEDMNILLPDDKISHWENGITFS